MDIDYDIRKDEPSVILATNTKVAIELYENWERPNCLSVMFIKTHIFVGIRGSIEKHNMIQDMLMTIDDQFIEFVTSLASTLIIKFSILRLIEVKGLRDHIMHMIDIEAQLKNLEVTISESFLVQYILCTLPQYSPLKISYNTHKEGWSISELLTMCVQEEERLLVEQGEKVLFTLPHCKGKNNAKNKGKGKTQPKASIKKESTCFFCKKKGHMKKDCAKHKAWLEKKGIFFFHLYVMNQISQMFIITLGGLTLILQWMF